MENLVTYAPYLGGAGLVFAGILYFGVLRRETDQLLA